MLEVRNLCKTYRSKDGVSVEATKDISLKFPERGMVFLLGRSGSGKSTLLHLLGGLDRPDSGDILIHGTSTKDFSGAMTDSYRNTYIGFIFQDYNVLPEFTVGGNIALALEMQGIRATNERINEILETVDLAEYGKRKPNELSGGQLQRVAIARAIIKDPDIILADEPTGALDSETGRAVFETLKKLSKTKLVIIVSHDRDYSEQFADRIIELADGCVISDTELKSVDELQSVQEVDFPKENGAHPGKSGVHVEGGYQLTDEDIERINYYLSLQSENNVLVTDGALVSPKRDRFQQTDEAAIVPEKTKFELIKSKLPWKRSFGIGLNSIRHRKAALFFMVFLSVVAFTLFGVADVFVSYDRVTCIVDTLKESEAPYLSLQKEPDYLNFREDADTGFSEEEIKQIEEALGEKLLTVSSSGSFLQLFNFYGSSGFTRDYDRNATQIYPRYSSAVIEANRDSLDAVGAKLRCGRLPEPNSTEVCISQIAAIGITRYGDEKYRGKNIEDLIGTRLRTFRDTSKEGDCVVVGILDIPVDYERYERLLLTDVSMLSEAERIVRQLTERMAMYECAYGVPSFVFCGEGSRDLVVNDALCSFGLAGNAFWDWEYEDDASMIDTFGIYSKMIGAYAVRVDGRGNIAPADDEVYVSGELMSEMLHGALYEELEGLSEEDVENIDFNELYRTLFTRYADKIRVTDPVSGKEYRVAGYIIVENASRVPMNGVCVVNDTVGATLTKEESIDSVQEIYCRMPESRSVLRDFVKSTTEPKNGAYTRMNRETTSIIETIEEVSKVLYPVFFWIGVVFAVFSAVLFSVFIANSIIQKKREIGVLRAIGARGLDVYRIFLCETGVIAFVNALLAILFSWLITGAINKLVQGDVLHNVILVHFGIRQVLLILAIAFGVAIVATFIPIWRIARRKPIDVIRDR
ncbi:MAG: ABC transporter ATP-binding protein/permease [Lachnospiraceae bacterium]|nr:ABC transporter ATP-binding protein/permease [Lachnospiraceae bacterium]